MFEGTQNLAEFGCFNLGPNVKHNHNLGVDIGIRKNDEQLSGEMLDNEYRKIIQS